MRDQDATRLTPVVKDVFVTDGGVFRFVRDSERQVRGLVVSVARAGGLRFDRK